MVAGYVTVHNPEGDTVNIEMELLDEFSTYAKLSLDAGIGTGGDTGARGSLIVVQLVKDSKTVPSIPKIRAKCLLD
jgi:hypothetical protein